MATWGAFGQVRIKNKFDKNDFLAHWVLVRIGGCGLVERAIIADNDGTGALESSRCGALNVPNCSSLPYHRQLLTADDEKA